jgi:hypothetical protein
MARCEDHHIDFPQAPFGHNGNTRTSPHQDRNPMLLLTMLQNISLGDRPLLTSTANTKPRMLATAAHYGRWQWRIYRGLGGLQPP